MGTADRGGCATETNRRQQQRRGGYGYRTRTRGHSPAPSSHHLPSSLPSSTSQAMTHILPPHAEVPVVQHSSISSALEMEQQQQQHPSPTSPQEAMPPASGSSGKKRKKGGEGEETAAMSEPRRLRRSHEACARCRSKKIKASPVGQHRHLSATP